MTRRVAAVGPAWGQGIGIETANEMRRELDRRGIGL